MSNRKNAKTYEELLPAIQAVLQDYFADRSNVSLNALSKRCAVSEPTLRRILKGQIKTLPNASTIIDILMTVSGAKSIPDLIKRYPGPIAKYLGVLFPQIQDIDNDQHREIRGEIANPIKYLIFKLSANAQGVSDQQLQDMFGEVGKRALGELVDKGIIEARNDRYFSKVKNFASSRKDFVGNFKLMCDFIKLKSETEVRRPISVKASYSESLNLESFKKIIEIQNKALQKISLIMGDESNYGNIPVFLLSAIDTFDTKSLFEDTF